jgi:transposase
MRGASSPQDSMFSYISLEDRVPASHPLRKLRSLVDVVLGTMSEDFDAVYSRVGRPSVPPERLLQALLLQILFSLRSERLLVESIDYNLLYLWFVGLGIDDPVWDHSTFSQNRERLFNADLARIFFERVRLLADWGKLTSSEHFSVDGTLIEAWASHKSEMALVRLSGVSGLVPSVDWLLYSAVRKEALLTSQIEGNQATLADRLRRGSRLRYRQHG